METLSNVEMIEELGNTTYCIEDNKLRFYYHGWLEKEIYQRFKKMGFNYAPTQECLVQVWTPGREDLCLLYSPDIEDEDVGPEERAATRAERFEVYSANAEQRGKDQIDNANKVAERFAGGQPILVGHHSEKSARKDQERIHNSMRRGIDELKKSEYWEWRAERSIKHQQYMKNWRTVANRIKKLKAAIRKNKASYTPNPKAGKIMQRKWLGVGEYSKEEVPHVYVGQARGGHWIAEESLPAIEKRAQRYIQHYEMQLAYWEKFYASRPKGGLDGIKEKAPEETNLEKGGAIYIAKWRNKGWAEILRINRSRDKDINSISVKPIDESDYRSRILVHPQEIKGVLSKAEVAEYDALTDIPLPEELVKKIHKKAKAAAERTEPTKSERDEILQAAAETADEIKNAEIKVNFNKDFYPTPATIAERMVQLSNIEPGMDILEPSAGGGIIIDKILELELKVHLKYCEINMTAQDVLLDKFCKNEQVSFWAGDFMTTFMGAFDRVIMNPPFSNKQAEKHIKHAYGLLKPGGRLVAIVSNGTIGNDYNITAFDEWLISNNGWVEEKIPAGSFKESGTGIPTNIIILQRN